MATIVASKIVREQLRNLVGKKAQKTKTVG